MRTTTRCVKADQRPLRSARPRAGVVGVSCARLTVGAPLADGSYNIGCQALDEAKTPPHTNLIHASLFPQMTASQIDEHIFQAGLPRSQVQKLRAILPDCIE